MKDKAKIKSEVLIIRVTEKEKEYLRAVAKEKSISDYVREKILQPL